MVDRNEFKKCCKDIVHTYINANFDSGSKVFRSAVNNCLQAVGITQQLSKPQETEVLQRTIYAELQEEFRYWHFVHFVVGPNQHIEISTFVFQKYPFSAPISPFLGPKSTR